ncbi:MAG: GyrI-like domain-containing protein [Hyphomonadaceae bacterium]
MAALEKPRFVDSPALYIVGLAKRYPRDQLSLIPHLWEILSEQMQFMSGRVGGKTYGVWYDVLKPGGGPMIYGAGVLTGEFAPVHLNFSRFNLPAQRYAVFPHKGAAADIRRTVDAIFTEWLPKSGKQHHVQAEGAADFFECYSEDFDRTTGRGEIEIWVPIKK